MNANVSAIYCALFDERLRQDAKWGEQNHPDGTGFGWLKDRDEQRAITDLAARQGHLTWLDILLEEVYEAFAEADPVKLRNELVQVAAVCVQWIECIDRRRTEGAT